MTESNEDRSDIHVEPEESATVDEVLGTPAEAQEAEAGDTPVSDDEEQDTPAGMVAEEPDWEALAEERTKDLQRLQAEYVNYKKRVDRDRSLARQAGVESVMLDLLPVLDSISLAREHDDLDGGFKLVAEDLEKIAVKHGLVAFGEVGDAFDPNRHDALMQVPLDGEIQVTTVSQVMQQGYALGDRVIRPARVGVANP